MKRYILSPEAKQDLHEIREHYLKEGGARVARYVLAEIGRAFVLLGGTPGAGHSREDLTTDPMKFWPVFSFLIIYDPVPRPIEIVRVQHSKRDLATLLRR